MSYHHHSIEPLPCPFCGKSDSVRVVGSLVVCCNANLGGCGASMHTGLRADGDPAVIEAWNARAPAPVSDKGKPPCRDCGHKATKHFKDGVQRLNCRVRGCLCSDYVESKPPPPADAALSEVAKRVMAEALMEHQQASAMRALGKLYLPDAARLLPILAAFAERVRAEEREACARIAESCPAPSDASNVIADKLRSNTRAGSGSKGESRG